MDYYYNWSAGNAGVTAPPTATPTNSNLQYYANGQYFRPTGNQANPAFSSNQNLVYNPAAASSTPVQPVNVNYNDYLNQQTQQVTSATSAQPQLIAASSQPAQSYWTNAYNTASVGAASKYSPVKPANEQFSYQQSNPQANLQFRVSTPPYGLYDSPSVKPPTTETSSQQHLPSGGNSYHVKFNLSNLDRQKSMTSTNLAPYQFGAGYQKTYLNNPTSLSKSNTTLMEPSVNVSSTSSDDLDDYTAGLDALSILFPNLKQQHQQTPANYNYNNNMYQQGGSNFQCNNPNHHYHHHHHHPYTYNQYQVPNYNQVVGPNQVTTTPYVQNYNNYNRIMANTPAPPPTTQPINQQPTTPLPFAYPFRSQSNLAYKNDMFLNENNSIQFSKPKLIRNPTNVSMGNVVNNNARIRSILSSENLERKRNLSRLDNNKLTQQQRDSKENLVSHTPPVTVTTKKVKETVSVSFKENNDCDQRHGGCLKKNNGQIKCTRSILVNRSKRTTTSPSLISSQNTNMAFNNTTPLDCDKRRLLITLTPPPIFSSPNRASMFKTETSASMKQLDRNSRMDEAYEKVSVLLPNESAGEDVSSKVDDDSDANKPTTVSHLIIREKKKQRVNVLNSIPIAYDMMKQSVNTLNKSQTNLCDLDETCVNSSTSAALSPSKTRNVNVKRQHIIIKQIHVKKPKENVDKQRGVSDETRMVEERCGLGGQGQNRVHYQQQSQMSGGHASHLYKPPAPCLAHGNSFNDFKRTVVVNSQRGAKNDGSSNAAQGKNYLINYNNVVNKMYTMSTKIDDEVENDQFRYESPLFNETNLDENLDVYEADESTRRHNREQRYEKTLSIVGSILDVPLPAENDAFSEYSTFVNNIFSKALEK